MLHIFLVNQGLKQVIDLQADDDKWESMEVIIPQICSTRQADEQEFITFYSEIMGKGKPNDTSIMESKG